MQMQVLVYVPECCGQALSSRHYASCDTDLALGQLLLNQYGAAKLFYFLFQPSYFDGKTFAARNMK